MRIFQVTFAFAVSTSAALAWRQGSKRATRASQTLWSERSRLLRRNSAGLTRAAQAQT